jgi:hypothetical protein
VKLRRLHPLTIDGEWSAQVHVALADGRPLVIEFGVALLDGCAPEDSVPVRIGTEPGRLRISKEPTGTWVELIWPATLVHPEGSYGLSSSFSRSEILTMARTMWTVTRSPAVEASC